MVLVAERPQAFDAQAAAAEIVSRLALLGGYLHSLINEGLEGRGEVGRRLGLEVHGHVMQSFQRGSHPRDVCSPLPSPAPNGPGYSTAAHDSDDQGSGMAGTARKSVV